METRRLRNIKQRDEMLRKLGFKKVHAVLDIEMDLWGLIIGSGSLKQGVLSSYSSPEATGYLFY